MNSSNSSDTIIAIATPPGRGGISILRISGPDVPNFSKHFLGDIPKPRYAKLKKFTDLNNQVIDHGLVIYFPAPHSYTGEHVLELQSHGSPIIMKLLIHRCLNFGIRMAQPGEFTERAFLNNRIDLAQAEAIADLISSSTEKAAKSAFNTFNGEFSKKVNSLIGSITELRMFVEAAIDFPDEEIDFLDDREIQVRLNELSSIFIELKKSTKCGRLLKDGLKVVLTGLPNAGKSSLLNKLSNENRAIVSQIPGTTRDILEESIHIDGLPIDIIDTAGIRESTNEIEEEGIKKALEAQAQADLILLVIDDAKTEYDVIQTLLEDLPSNVPVIMVHNKIDLSHHEPGSDKNTIYLSTFTEEGIDMLKSAVKTVVGYQQSDNSLFIARERHVDAIKRAKNHLDNGINQIKLYKAGELLAEELLNCQRALSEITGGMTKDHILDMIFRDFCIGK